MEGDLANWSTGMSSHAHKKVTFVEATSEGVSRILFMGNRRSGKSSINKVIFQNMSPHETLFLESTVATVDITTSANKLLQMQVWDFGGDEQLSLT